MFTNFKLAAAILTVCLMTAPVLAAEAHVHGQANLSVAVDGDTLTIMLESPTDSLVGFEHAPRNAKERAAIDKMKLALNQPADLFRPTLAAGCKSTRVKLESSLFEADQDDDHHKHHKGHEGHADLDGEFVFQCAQPKHLHDLDVRLFERFPSMKKLNVEVAGPKGQKAVQLNATQHKVSW